METVVDGLHIRYQIDGEGDTVLVLQGWGTRLEVYQSIADILSSGYQVVRLDLPGFGESEEPKASMDVEGFVDFLLHFLEKLGIKKASLIGHSYGGRMIIRLCAREQKAIRLEKLVLIDSAGIYPKKTKKQLRSIKRYKRLKKMADWKLVQYFFGSMVAEWKKNQGSADYRAASPIMKECLVKAVNEDLTELLPKVTQETLLIWGDQDTATPISDAKLMEERMPNAGLVTFAGAGHYSFLEQPALFSKVLRSYFKI